MRNELDTTFTQCPHGSPKCELCENIRVIHWISVEYSLPKHGQYVLTYLDCSIKAFRSNWYDVEQKKWHEGDDGITHWASLEGLSPCS